MYIDIYIYISVVYVSPYIYGETHRRKNGFYMIITRFCSYMFEVLPRPMAQLRRV